MKILNFIIILLLFSSCGSKKDQVITEEDTPRSTAFYYGADLSYVNELEDCGAVYKNKNGFTEDVYHIFKNEGANLIRIRLWHNPTWTNYSNYEDVKKSISRAKEQGVEVLLDFHYSDEWADPEKQYIPEAWLDKVNDTAALGALLYEYTYTTLDDLDKEGLLPEMVQVGNETNAMILQEKDSELPMDWARNSFLINKGIKAVRDIAKEKNKDIGVMLHIAQPENALWWFKQAAQNNVTDYDWIGLSYYPIWSEYSLDKLSGALKTLITSYDKRLMVVETAYPYTLDEHDAAGNILGTTALIDGFPASPQGQLDYLNQLKESIQKSGGEGLIYWEPAWVSTTCFTKWGQGSHWDNATLFDSDNQVIKSMEFYNNNVDTSK